MSLRLRLLVFVGVPTLVAALYYGLIASDLYQSQSKYMIESADGGTPVALNSLLGALPVVGTAGERDARAVQAYILSPDVLSRLDKEQGFIAHYQSKAIDWWTRIPANATFETMFKYYLGLVEVRYDSQSGVSTLLVKAATADDARRFAHAILRYAEQMVNELSERARSDRMAFAAKEVKAGEQRLAKARAAILAQQAAADDINPKESASAILTIRTELETELAMARAELRQMASFVKPQAHQIQALKQKVASLEEQVRSENLKLVDPKSRSLSTSIARFEPLVIEKEFAQKAYATALAALEVARTEVAQQHRYLATIVGPSAPDEPTHPKRLLDVLSVFAVALTLFGIVSLLVAAAREHANL